jgi:uncharacterized protein
MSVALTLLLVVSGFGAGVLDAIAGGGGLVALPVLLVAGLPVHVAIPTNKGQATFGAIASVTTYWRGNSIDRERVAIGFGMGVLGSCVGAAAVLALKPELLRPIVLVLLVFAAFVVLLRGRLRSKPRANARGPAHPDLVTAVIAFTLGAYDGFFGPGVGTFLIIAFVLAFGDTFARASANAKVVNFAANLAALGIFAARGAVLWRIAVPMGIANAIGAALGARLAMTRGDRLVRVVLFVVVCALLVKLSVDLVGSR